MANPKEYEIQDAIRKALETTYELYPYDIIYIDQQQGSLSLLKITVWIKEDLNTIKDIIDFPSLCDKTGFLEFQDTNTVIIRGYALLNFLRALNLMR